MQRLNIVEDIISIASGKTKLKLKDKVEAFNKAREELYSEVNMINKVGDNVKDTVELILPIAIASNKESNEFDVMFGGNLIANYTKMLKSMNAVYLTDTLRIAYEVYRPQTEGKQLLVSFGKDPLRPDSKILKSLYSCVDADVVFEKYNELNEAKLTKEEILSQLKYKDGLNFTTLFRDDLSYDLETNSSLQIDLSNLINTFVVLSNGPLKPFTDSKENHPHPDEELFVVPHGINLPAAWLEIFEDYKELDDARLNLEKVVASLLK